MRTLFSNKVIAMLSAFMLFIACFLPLSSYSINLFEVAKITKQYLILILPLVSILLLFLLYLDYFKVARVIFVISLLPFILSLLYVMIMKDVDVAMFGYIGVSFYLMIISLILGLVFSKESRPSTESDIPK